ncbi:DMT family transporter [Silvanigrella aquatica]|uniref:EamA domain-containing protein n=1 Tax=Silvanigrella aquatica TaxID=1915309 RepID=A0A1L4CXZ9_9BACT|nr:DMT family transporter [Silvanigrella aquatica]APJ02816.1 hypothetical protein AXG55_02325 [Silvanigrella aquatica]
MTFFILLAILNGIVIGINRSVNGKLSFSAGPLKASFWNHAVGFLLLTLLVYFFDSFQYFTNVIIPPTSLLGGVLGAFFVILSCFVFTKLGAVKTALFVISGQMISSLLIDFNFKNMTSIIAQILGIILIIFGIYLSKVDKVRFLQLNLKKYFVK